MSAATTCQGCGKGYEATLGRCPFCNRPNPAPVKDAELDRKLFTAGAADLAARQRASKRLRLATVVLLALALPTVVPALLVNFLMAKRWGRVDFLIIGVDLLVICLIASQSMLFVPALISAAAAAAVFILRHAHREEGIALGFPALVMTPAMAGGALLLGSFAVLGSRAGLAPTIERLRPPRLDRDVAAAALEGQEVLVRGDDLDWEQVVYCTPDRCSDQDPSEAVELGAAEIMARRDELLGSAVTLAGEARPAATFDRAGMSVRATASSPATPDPAPRQHGLVPGTHAKLWIASAPGGVLGAGPYSGRLVYVENDAEFARRYQASGQADPLPMLALTIVAGEGVETGSGVEAWSPLVGAGDRVWVALPFEVDELGEARGLVRDRERARVQLCAARPSLPGLVTVVAVGLEQAGPRAPMVRSSVLFALLGLLVGLALSGWSLVAAWRET